MQTISHSDIILPVNNRHRVTLERIFANRVPADLAWRDVEALLRALDASLSEGNGSRIRVELNGVLAVFHRPHPQPNTDKGAVKSVRIFLENAGVKP
ncbi:type II toxin-antitoxin system HicA family toxin [Inquilinus sp. CAU 1745]|uniref:type II toxin-antitoxin system HicA family toxin n=1 Tax=Inquilinus sp. CAU 1745 TaxID=3140369 RepID=UPI00325C0230